eukprot:gb/GECH01006836.1/.p1 GENE.gb/GECH01006836.1/~~gb/GECH01006836.1/.p1  ORF type:complete len:311 (+),score=103.70 gb/GECH01006836.1/:1-933(+)
MGNVFQKKCDIPEQYLRPQGLYPRCDWDERTVRKLIINKSLAPCYPGQDEDKLPEDKDPTIEECPICMLNYPGGLNRCNCCNQSICTECYLQIKKPKQGSAVCPFCNASNYSVQYKGPKTQEEIQEEQIEQQHVLELQVKAQQEQQKEEQRRREERLAAETQGSSSSAQDFSQQSNSNYQIEALEEYNEDSNSNNDNNTGNNTDQQRNNENENISNDNNNNNTTPEHLRDYIPQGAPEGMSNEEAEEWMLREAIRMSLSQEDSTEQLEASNADNATQENLTERNTTGRSDAENEELMLAIALSMSMNRDS